MKALSLTQPMAYAVVALGKNIENRPWNTGFRGHFYVHASKSFNREHYDWILDRWFELGLEGYAMPPPDEFIHGAIIGEAELVGIADSHSSPWFMGPHGFMLKGAREYDAPIYCRGHLGFFEVDNIQIDNSTGLLVARTQLQKRA